MVGVDDDKDQHSITTENDFDTISTESTLYKCLHLLSSTDIDSNKVGLQRLMLLTKGRRISSSSSSTDLVAPTIVYGGPLGSIQEQLRYIFSTMICDDPHNDYYHDDDGITQAVDVDDELLDCLNNQKEGDKVYENHRDSISSYSSSSSSSSSEFECVVHREKDLVHYTILVCVY